MYILEMFCWAGKFHSEVDGPDAEVSADDLYMERRLCERSSTAPADEGSVFNLNERCIDLQGAWQEDKRGLITFIFLGLMYVWQCLIMLDMVLPGIVGLFNGINPFGRPVVASEYFFYPLFGIIWLTVNALFFKYCWRWLRLEVFVQRRLVVRFNRITRQVHINRPNYAGGLVTFPWDAVLPEISGSKPGSGAGDGALLMGWPSHRTGAGFDDICMIGGSLDDRGSAEALWEYIRRYMEEGPDEVPEPKHLRALFPWPWDSVRSTLSFLLPSWRNGDKGLVLTGALLLSPLLILHCICHWLSLLLCWPTYWPRIIRCAGLPGEPVPKLTTADDYSPEIAVKLRASTVKVVGQESSQTPPDERQGMGESRS